MLSRPQLKFRSSLNRPANGNRLKNKTFKNVPDADRHPRRHSSTQRHPPPPVPSSVYQRVPGCSTRGTPAWTFQCRLGNAAKRTRHPSVAARRTEERTNVRTADGRRWWWKEKYETNWFIPPFSARRARNDTPVRRVLFSFLPVAARAVHVHAVNFANGF